MQTQPQVSPASTSTLLELRGVTKRFPGVVALNDVTVDVRPGEVMALIGENGAGKSTLMKILGGVYQRDEGEIFWNGQKVEIGKVTDAMKLGVAFIHQELNVLDNIDVAGNVFLGREIRWAGPFQLINQREMVRQAEVHLKRLGLDIRGDTPLSRLSIAQQQMVEIAKALSLQAKLIIMDEPTSSLTLTETDRLLATIKELRSQGVSIIYISHRLGEIIQIADRVIALRDGKNAGSLSREQVSHDAMVRLMVGRQLRDMFVPASGKTFDGSLVVRDLVTRYRPACRVSFEARRGEILGFAGLVGAGRSEIMQAIFGVEPAISGQILLDGTPLKIKSAHDAIAAGITLAPEDRRRTGLVTEMSVRENISLPGLKDHSTLGLISRSSETIEAKKQISAMAVKTPGAETRVLNLSGGNQQKVVLGKWLALHPKVLIFDEPTRGIDVGAKAEIYKLMRHLAEEGVVVIMVSSDMEEVLGVSDRIAVIHEGSLSGILDRRDFSEEAVMNLAVGAKKSA